MLVALLVYIASYFGYVITENEMIQEEKDILLKPQTLTIGPGALFRKEKNGSTAATVTFGFEKQLTPLSRNIAWHLQYRFASKARDASDITGDFTYRDHYFSFGLLKYLSNEKTAIYINTGPYINKRETDIATTIGLSQSMSAFGAGFRPNIYLDCINEKGCQIGIFANFEIF